MKLFAQVMGLDTELSEEELLKMAELSIEDGSEDGEFDELSELDSEVEDDMDEDMSALSQIGTDDTDELMFNEVAEFLAQIDDDDRTALKSLVGQVLAEQYSETGNILLALGLIHEDTDASICSSKHRPTTQIMNMFSAGPMGKHSTALTPSMPQTGLLQTTSYNAQHKVD